MEANYFTILWWFLPYINMNQPRVHMCPAVLNPPPASLPTVSIPLGCPRAPALSARLHASNLHWPSIVHMVIYMFTSLLKSSILKDTPFLPTPRSPSPHTCQRVGRARAQMIVAPARLRSPRCPGTLALSPHVAGASPTPSGMGSWCLGAAPS